MQSKSKRTRCIAAVLAVLVLVGALFSEFLDEPERWKAIAPGMADSEVMNYLGPPDQRSGDKAFWYDHRVFGDWMLTLTFRDGRVSRIVDDLKWAWTQQDGVQP